jgi:hypothetical protein
MLQLGISVTQSHQLPTNRIKTHTVVMIPSPQQWGARRALVNAQFMRESWKTEQVVLVYILGTRSGAQVETLISPSRAMQYEADRYAHAGILNPNPNPKPIGIEYVFSDCRVS